MSYCWQRMSEGGAGMPHVMNLDGPDTRLAQRVSKRRLRSRGSNRVPARVVNINPLCTLYGVTLATVALAFGHSERDSGPWRTEGPRLVIARKNMLPAGHSLPCLGERVTSGLPDAGCRAVPGLAVALSPANVKDPGGNVCRLRLSARCGHHPAARCQRRAGRPSMGAV
jgi:hypothetical protein